MPFSPGTDPPSEPWTCADVERWLKTAFRAMPYTPIYAPRADTNHMESMDKNKPSATFDIAAFAATVLGRRSDECRAVLVWARTMAAREIGEASIAEFCREMGWNRRTFDRRRVRACDKIAAAKNNIQKT